MKNNIAVLVAIAIPIFTTQLEKSRESTDLSNIRAAYAEVSTAGLTEDSANYTKEVTPKQKKADWQSSNLDTVGGIPVGDGDGQINAKTSGTWAIVFNETTQEVTIDGVAVPSTSGSGS